MNYENIANVVFAAQLITGVSTKTDKRYGSYLEARQSLDTVFDKLPELVDGVSREAAIKELKRRYNV